MPENTVFYVTDVCIPHVWNTIETGFNDKLFMSYSIDYLTGENYVPVTLTEGDYTLTQFASELQTKSNEAELPPHKTNIAFVVTGNLRNNTITISVTQLTAPNAIFKIYTDAEVIAEHRSKLRFVDPNDLQSANDVITNVQPNNRNTPQKKFL